MPLALLLACASPAQHYEETALRMGFARGALPAGGSELVVYAPREARAGRRLHVYIEGDGSPRHASRFIPPDATPTDPLMLRLMRLDPAPSLLLGRPCQHAAQHCDVRSFTLARYGKAVVAAMTQALASQLRRAPREVVLIGFSGGGTLAMLLAERLPEAVALVTIAGNLDVAAWAAHHGYLPLRESLDPARLPALRGGLLQLHLQAGRDEVVPTALVQRAIARQPGAIAKRYPEFDHRCCWEQAWPALLSELEAQLEARRESR